MVYDLDQPVRARMFGHVTQKAGAWHNGMSAPNHIILYGTEGVLGIEMEGERYYVAEGDVLHIPVGVHYRPLEGGRCSYFFFHFSAHAPTSADTEAQKTIIAPHTGLAAGYAYTCLGEYSSTVRLPTYVSGAPFSVRALFERAARLKPGKRFSDRLLLDHLVRELLLLLDTGERGAVPRLEEITEYIEQHSAEPITLSSLAEQFSLSPSYIARLFRCELKQKPSEYVSSVRIAIACTLLSETDMTVTEIAERTGFSDVYYFSRVFKKAMGASPLKMRGRR